MESHLEDQTVRNSLAWHDLDDLSHDTYSPSVFLQPRSRERVDLDYLDTIIQIHDILVDQPMHKYDNQRM